MQNEAPNAQPIKYQFIFSSFIEPPKFTFTYNPELKTKIITSSVDTSIYHDYSTSSMSESIEIMEKFVSLHACDKLLSILLKQPDLSIFRNPVETKKPGMEKYLDIIKEPMDLSTLQRKLRNGCIPTISEFRRSLALIWTNSETFWGPDDVITKSALNIKRVSEDFFGKLPVPSESTALEKLKKMDENMTKLESILDTVLHIPPRPKIDKPREPKPQPKQPKVVEQKVVITRPTQNELKRIAATLAQTPPADLKPAWDILYAHKGDKTQLNLNDLPENVQIELKRLVLKL